MAYLIAVMITEEGSSLAFTPYHIYSGSMCLITGNPGYTSSTPPPSPPNNPVTGTAQNDWGEGMLFDENIGEPEYSLDLTELGSFGNQSDITLKLPNLNSLVYSLRAVGFNINGATLRYYVVDTTSGFTHWFTAKLDASGFSSTELSLNGKSPTADRHTVVPPKQVDYNDFPEALDTVIGKTIPIAYGRVTRAKLLKVQSVAEPKVLSTFDSVDYNYAPVLDYDVDGSRATIELWVGDRIIADNEFSGLWLHLVKGGPKAPLKIVNNSSSDGSFVTSVFVTLEGYWPNEAGDPLASVNHADPAPVSTWWAQIRQSEFPHIVSDSTISEIKLDPTGSSEELTVYDRDAGQWVDYAGLKSYASTFSINGTKYPGILVFGTDSNNGTASKEIRRVIKPSEVRLLSSDYGDGSYSKTNVTLVYAPSNAVHSHLYDKDLTTGIVTSITMQHGFYSGNRSPKIRNVFRATIPKINNQIGAEKYSVCMNVQLAETFDEHYVNVGGIGNWVLNHRLDATIYAVDITGTKTVAAKVGGLMLAKSTNFTGDGSLTSNAYGIPRGYAGGGVLDTTDVHLQTISLDITSLMADSWSLGIYDEIEIDLVASTDLEGTGTVTDAEGSLIMTVSEVAVMLTSSLNVDDEDLATRVIGRTFLSTWGSRKTVGNPIYTPPEVIEDLLREYDGLGDFIDTTSFDSANTYFNSIGVKVGNQIVDPKLSSDHIRDICRQSDSWLAPMPNGKFRYLLPFNATSTFTLDADLLLEWGEPQAVDPRMIYNQFDVQWNFDPGPGRFRNRIKIAKTDEAFPALDYFDGGTTSLTFTNYQIVPDESKLRIVFPVTSYIHTGHWIRMTSGQGGMTFTLKVEHSTKFANGETWAFVDASTLSGYGLTPGTNYTAGTIVRMDKGAPKYTEMISGFPTDYLASGEYLHEKSNEAYEVSRIKNTLKLDLSWFTDAENWGDLWTLNAAYSLLVRLILSRIGYPRYVMPFVVPINSTTLAWYVGQRGTFDFDPISNGEVPCWIQRLRLEPRGYDGRGCIRGEIMFMLDGPLA